MSIHNFVRCIPTALTEEYLLELIYKYWPHPYKKLSAPVLKILVKKIATELVPPKETQALETEIKKVWSKKRKKTEKDAALGKLSDEQEQLLKNIFDNFSRGSLTLHVTLCQKISTKINVTTDEIKNIWKHRKLSKHFDAFIKKQTAGANLTPEEDELLGTIWQIWPQHQRNFNIDKMYPLIKAAYENKYRPLSSSVVGDLVQSNGGIITSPKLTSPTNKKIPTREDVINLKNFWRYFSLEFSRFGNRLCVAANCKIEWLFDYYCEQGDDVNEFGGSESDWKKTKEKDENGNTIYKKTVVKNWQTKEKVVETSIIDQRNEYKDTPLEIVCTNGYMPIFRRLMSKGADVTLGRPLHRACKKAKNEIIVELLKKDEIKPQLNGIYDYDETTPLLAYVDNKHSTLDTVKLLLEKGANPNSKKRKTDWSNVDGEMNVLMLCCESTTLKWSAGHKNIFEFLVQNRAKYNVDLDAVSQHKFSALHYAVKYKQLDMVHQLLKAGANPNILNKDGQTPLNLALCDSRLKKIKKLLEKYKATAQLGECRLINHSVKTRISLIHQQVRQEIGVRSESPTSGEMKENDNCVKFSMNQGQAGICYMVSIITIFRNEYTLLNKLEECLMDDWTLQVYEMVDFLTKDYSNHDFTQTCPIIPKSWQSAVSSKAGEVGLQDVNNGGDSTSLMLYILYSMQSAFPNIFKVDVRLIRVQNFEEQFMKVRIDWLSSENNILFVDVRGFTNMDVNVDSLLTFEKLCEFPEVRGMLVTVQCDGAAHIFAATVCEDGQVFYCNSWGHGCVQASDVVEELIAKRDYKILVVQYLIRK